MKVNFLNWRPDVDDVGNDGLTKAENVIHDVEGYRPVHLASSGAFTTTGGLAASNATVLSIVAKPVGSTGDLFCAWVAGSPPKLHVGLNGATATTTATGYPLAMATAATDAEIFAFDVCEYGGNIVWTVEAQGTDASATALSYAFCGYMSY